MTEMLHAYVNMHKRGGYFIFKYILVAFSMWKWRPPQGHELSLTLDNIIGMQFEPWKARRHHSPINYI
jgi:hypothetical protein